MNDMQKLEERLKHRRAFVVREPEEASDGLVSDDVTDEPEPRRTNPKADEVEAGPDGVPLPAGLRFRWRGRDGDVMEIVVLPGDGRSYRATAPNGRSIEGTATLEQLRGWFEARVLNKRQGRQ